MKIMDVKEAADFLSISVETIRVLARNKQIPCAKVGRLWRFNDSDLIDFIRTKYGNAPQDTE
jgi:excisionase family DNA binding protein